MKNIKTDELKCLQLDMLKDVIAFCEEHQIKYFLAFGTLLGAIRHKGYIPWDDDVDICLPRPDYERFVSMYENNEKNYKVVEFRKTKGYGLPFAKVSNENTVINEFLYDTDVFGVYIDVFPLDGVANRRQIVLSKFLRKMLNAKKAVLGNNRSFGKNIVIALGKMILSPISVKKILTRMHCIATKYDYCTSKQVGILCSPTVEKEIVARFLFEKDLKIDFEGLKANVPSGYDEYLVSLYGDYMRFPPVEQRISHHVFEAWWKE